MVRKLLHKHNFFIYPVFFVVILSGLIVFYLSCKSKSPTESTAALNSQVADQSANNTNQTTTSSSTTTTVQPGNSPTNTTTLITSRYLTTTSTRTTTTTTTTTSIMPTTTALINPCGMIDLRVVSKPAIPDGAIIPAETPMSWRFCNYGSTEAQLCHFVIKVDGITEYSFGDKLVRPGRCVLVEWIFSPFLYPLGPHEIFIKWNYCDSQGNRCNEKPFITVIGVVVAPPP